MMGRDANLKVVKAPSIRTMNLFFNYGRGPLANVKVGEAIATQSTASASRG